MSNLDRRTFLGAAAVAAAVPIVRREAVARPITASRAALVGSGNARPAITLAMERIREGVDPVEAIVAGINIVENNPNDHSVGYGGLPNEDGVVELDSSVMHGPSHKAGAVAALRNIRNPSSVALEVLRRTDHVMLVGEGALKFARRLGFEEQELLTDASRAAWVRWRSNLNPDDDWLDDDQRIKTDTTAEAGARRDVPFTHGTIHVSAVDDDGNVSACTSTSGLSYKVPGRVGDSPIVGAGMFVDNAVGSAGATGRGEAVIQSAGAFAVVRHMAEGLEPTEACLAVLKWIADHTKRPDLLNDKGEPRFNVAMYALRKDGVVGAASLRGGARFTSDVGSGPEVRSCPSLF